MAMGWWKPYFFLDPKGVQLLLPTLVIDDSFETLFTSAIVVLLLSLLERYAAHFPRRNPDAPVPVAVMWFTAQKFTSGLLMLIMMSFNVPLFLAVVLFGGAAELAFKLHEPRRGPGFVGVPTAPDVELGGC